MQKKKILLALGISSILHQANSFAMENQSENMSYCTDENCCPQLENDFGVSVYADFLYWYAKESNLAYALVSQTLLGLQPFQDLDTFLFQVTPKRYKTFDEKWGPGFRVGLGFNGWDSLDFSAYWTSINTVNKKSAKVSQSGFTTEVGKEGFPLASALYSPWLNPADFIATGEFVKDALNSAVFFDQIDAKWRLNYRLVDFEIGKDLCFSSCFYFRPYLGMRGGWTKTKFSTTCHLLVNFVDNSAVNSYQVKFANKFSGFGISGGFQPNWYLGYGFGLWGNIGSALLWGNNKIQRKEFYSLLQTSNNGEILTDQTNDLGTFRNRYFDMQPVVDLSAGVHWESYFLCNRYRLGLDVAWEQHFWLNHVRRLRMMGKADVLELNTSDGAMFFTSFDESVNSLVLGGVTLRVCFDF